jgi:ATP-binding cassette subfamily F protein uup
LLLLDEPTNDLDIPTLEILEESLLEFPGALVLVTHDRYMLDRVSTTVLGLDGAGGAERCADYSQWEAWQRARKKDSRQASRESQLREIAVQTTKPQGKGSGSGTNVAAGRAAATAESKPPSAHPKKKLSYNEARELETIEKRIADAEEELRTRQNEMGDPTVMSDAARLRKVCVQVEAAQKNVEDLYARWSALEKRRAESA